MTLGGSLKPKASEWGVWSELVWIDLKCRLTYGTITLPISVERLRIVSFVKTNISPK
jgi:hypothetical protein